MAQRKVKPARELVHAKPRVVVMDTTEQLIQAMIKAAGNPEYSVEKMKELVMLREQMEARAAKIAFDEALAEMQGGLPQIDRRGRIVIRRKDAKTGERTGPVEQSTGYAKWEDINEIIQPILHKWRFSLSFRIEQDPSGRIAVTGILARAGHREQTTIVLQHDSTGSKNAVQAVGSTTSYGKRYTGCALLNIITRGEDDDGSAFREPHMVSQEQLAELNTLASDIGVDIPRFCALFKVSTLADIPALRFEEAKNQMERKRKRKAASSSSSSSDFPGDTPMTPRP